MTDNETYNISMLQLNFRVLSPINKLPHFHGIQWKGLLQSVVHGYIDGSLGNAGVFINPIETGISSYSKGDQISLGIVFPSKYSENIKRLIQDFNDIQVTNSHFMPGRTIKLESWHDRLGASGEEFGVLQHKDIKDEIEQLQSLNSFSIRLISPLKAKRPVSEKTGNNSMLDYDYFVSMPDRAAARLFSIVTKSDDKPELKLDYADLLWTGYKYGVNNNEKSLYGIIGNIKLRGRLSQKAAEQFVLHQYLGIGDSRSYGFGFYIIPELDNFRHIKDLQRWTTHADRMLSESYTQKLSPGINDDLCIYSDIMIQKIISKKLANIFEAFFQNSSQAYRREARVSSASMTTDGYKHGIRIEREKIYESIGKERTLEMMKSLFPCEPLNEVIEQILHAYPSSGLPVECDLSHILSNLFMTPFGSAIEKMNLKLIKRSDDFIILSRSNDLETIEGNIAGFLANLGLSINITDTKFHIF